MATSYNINGKTALVTGANRGIGKVIVETFLDKGGIGEIAEPPSLVVDSILEALEKGLFHAFPDSMAKQFELAYQGFSQEIVNTDLLSLHR